MNSYYSSDEEVAWGPVTLREIKGDLKRTRKPERRYTIHPCPKAVSTSQPKITLEHPTFCQEMEEICNVSSTCDEYYSPNESVVSSSNGLVKESSVYLTASETKTTMNSRNSSRVSSAPQCHDDTHVNFVKAAMNRDSYFDIQNFHQTLVEHTMFTPEKSFSHNICPNNSTGSTESQEEVIVISSDEDESIDNGKDIKSEKYSYFGNVSMESEDFPEKNRSLREIEEGSIYKTDEASIGGTIEGNIHNCTFESDISNEKQNSSYHSTSSGNVDEINCESSDEDACPEKSAFTIDKQLEKSIKISSTSDSESNSDDVLCIDEDAEASFVENAEASFVEDAEPSLVEDAEPNLIEEADASFVEENEIDIEREPSIHKANDELCKGIEKTPNRLNGRKSRKSFVDECNYSSSSDDDGAEVPIDLPRQSRTNAIEQEKYAKYYVDNNDSLDIDNEKQEVHHGIAESHNETDLLKSEHLPRSYNISPVIVPNIDLTQFDDTYDGLSQLNDTMEMMDMLLNQGRKTSYCDGGSSNGSSDKPSGNSDNDNIISASFLQKPTSSLVNTEKHVTPLKNRVDNIKPNKITPNGRFDADTPFKATPLKATQLGKATPGKSCKSQIPKLRKSPSGDNFKMPITPVWQRIPTRASPKPCSNFQNIVSPVGMYIRYSPKPVFKQKVESTNMGKVNVNPPSPAQHKNKENFDGLPSVIYKPGRRQIATADKKQPLPPSLEKMIKESDLTKHNRKVIQYKSALKVQQQLDDGIDLTRCTISDSLLEDPSQDVSILHKRDRPFLN